MPDALTPPAAPAPARRRLPAMLLLSLALHGAVLLGVRFRAPDRAPQAVRPPLEVVLVNSRSERRPQHALALAQANLDGGGNTDADRRAASPLPGRVDAAEPSLEQRSRQVQALEAQARALLTQLRRPAWQTDAVRPGAEPQPQPAAPDTGAADRNSEAASLEAKIAREWDAYQKRPKRRFIGARTREYRFARYVEAWRARVERVGNLNYPEAARSRHLYGKLLLAVSIRADGRLENVAVVRSSGQPLLDQAAVAIVRLAAPFAALPPDIRRDTDVLSITREWQFTREDQLVGE